MADLISNTQDLPFCSKPSTIMHIDLNSCFATIEQQANPKLRGKPIAVAAYASSNGCILAPSIEAKRYGIKTGMRVKDAKLLYSDLIVLSPDPWKYRTVHLKLRKLISSYTDRFSPKSIDEFVLDLANTPCCQKGMFAVGFELKQRIKKEIGDWLTVSVGIAPNRFLAKTAAGLKKPDGLEEINKENYLEVFSRLKLTDLCGIAKHNKIRLNNFNIYTVLDFYKMRVEVLRAAFHSVVGQDWYIRLRGWEVDDAQFARRSYGNSYALPKPLSKSEELAPILQKLVEKMGFRLRKAGFKASGIHLALAYRDGNYWHRGKSLSRELFESRDIFKEAFKILCSSPYKSPVSQLAVSCFNLLNSKNCQLNLFENILQKEKLTQAVDTINERWGSFVITPARMINTENVVHDRIAFGGVKELEEFTFGCLKQN